MRKGNEKKVLASLGIAVLVLVIAFVAFFTNKSSIISSLAKLSGKEQLMASTKIGTNGSVNPDYFVGSASGRTDRQSERNHSKRIA